MQGILLVRDATCEVIRQVGSSACAPAGLVWMVAAVEPGDLAEQVALGMVGQVVGLGHGEARIDGGVELGSKGMADPADVDRPHLGDAGHALPRVARRRPVSKRDRAPATHRSLTASPSRLEGESPSAR